MYFDYSSVVSPFNKDMYYYSFETITITNFGEKMFSVLKCTFLEVVFFPLKVNQDSLPAVLAFSSLSSALPLPAAGWPLGEGRRSVPGHGGLHLLQT